MPIRLTGHLAVWGLACVLIAGCSEGTSLQPVTGKVVYKGQPLAGALVTLHPKDNNDPRVVRPVGYTQEDGTFKILTGKKEGAPVGKYVVTVICNQKPQSEKKEKSFSTGGDDDTVDLLGGAYANFQTSKLTFEVKAGPNDLPIDLK